MLRIRIKKATDRVADLSPIIAEIRASGATSRITPTPHPMDTMPVDLAEEDRALLYCPEQGGWHTAVFFERRWVDFATLTLELAPTHWLPIPPAPEDA